ncbi:MAG: NTP transferase domain-containing protein [Actinobacteria bacterium]|nr:NTP transferase domain-containing protein [Actinomycetota bacterium]MTH92373.1 NTP transferase domain-containing protein [Actinomycetota bacterium]
MELKSTSMIVLTGGTSTRFGSDKAAAVIDGQSLISRILCAIPDEIEVIIVGPDPKFAGRSYRCVQEVPPGGGPVAGYAAALEICTSEIVALLATDMPFAVTKVINLINAMKSHDDAVMYVDHNGFKQPLAAIYRVEAVEKALLLLGSVAGKSMRELISHLDIAEVEISKEISDSLRDIDTPADLDIAIAFAATLKDNPDL